MDIIKELSIPGEISPDDITPGAEFSFGCCVHKIKKRSTFTFVYLRTGRYVFTAVHNPKFCEKPLRGVFEGVYINVKCFVREEKRAENGMELTITDYEVLSKPFEKYPMPVSDGVLDCAPEEIAGNRAVSCRHPLERAPMRVFGKIVESFSEYMSHNGFVKVHTPGITVYAPEKEKDMLSVDYFGNAAYLSSDRGVYCQGATAFFDRVYDVSETFSGKKRNSPRLLNEYTALRFDVSYIKGKHEVMAYLVSVIKHMCVSVSEKCKYEADLLEAVIPDNFEIPSVSFNEVMEKLGKEAEQLDLDPTDEKRICKWAMETYGSEFVFVTGLPDEKRAFYYKTDENFVLLFRGMEIASGGEKISDYAQIEKKNVPDNLRDFYMYGMPPHGGVAIGAERFAARLLKLNDIRMVSLYPRDIHIITP